MYSIYRQCVCLRGGGGELCCRAYSSGILHSVSDQIQHLPNCFTTPHTMTSEDDIKGLVSLKFLRPCLIPYLTNGLQQRRTWRSPCTTTRTALTRAGCQCSAPPPSTTRMRAHAAASSILYTISWRVKTTSRKTMALAAILLRFNIFFYTWLTSFFAN